MQSLNLKWCFYNLRIVLKGSLESTQPDEGVRLRPWWRPVGGALGVSGAFCSGLFGPRMRTGAGV